MYKITLATAIDDAVVDDVMIEAAASGSGKQALVTNPNMVLPCDFDCLYAPATGDEDFDGARYFLSPILSKLAYLSRMSPIPASVQALNKSRVVGWFEI